jgi:hypothetical protein
MSDSSESHPLAQDFAKFGFQYPSQGGGHAIYFPDTRSLQSEFHTGGITHHHWDRNNGYIPPFVEGSIDHLPNVSGPEDLRGAYGSLLEFMTDNDLMMVCLYCTVVNTVFNND